MNTLFTQCELDKIIKKRDKTDHKGTYGKLLLIGGSLSMAGAIAMATKASLRAGGGVVTTLVPQNIHAIVAGASLSSMTYPLPVNGDALSYSSINKILDYAKTSDTLVIGCGMTLTPHTMKIVEDVVRNVQIPIIIDADGINALSLNINILRQKKGEVILTPHLGEMSRLCGKSISYIERNKTDVAKAFATEYSVTLVLKGPNTITASANGDIYVNTSGNSGLATGGSGDVLAGVICALVASTKDPFKGSGAAVFVHGLAADIAARHLSQYSLLPTDVIDALPFALKKYDFWE